MRITDKTTANNAIYNINEGRLKLDRMNERISSGRNVNRPSDDPVATKKILEIETQMKTSTQYISNIKSGQTWLAMAGTSLEGLLSTVMTIRGAAGQAQGGVLDPVKKAELVNQLKFLRDQLTDYPNVQVGSQYVFSGYKNDAPPFGSTTVVANTTAGSTSITGIDTTDLYEGLPISGPGIPADSTVALPITASSGPGMNDGVINISSPATVTAAAASLKFTGKFNGTEDAVTIEINRGVQLPINVSGGKAVRGGTPPGSSGVDLIKTLDTLVLHINNDNIAGVQSDNLAFDQATKELLGSIGEVGMRKARMDNALEAQQRNFNILSGVHDTLQNIDMAAAAISLENQKNAFEAALAATAKVAPLSLLNFLR